MTCRLVPLVTIAGILAVSGCQNSCCRPGGFAPAPKPLAPGLAPVPFPGAAPIGQPAPTIQPPTPIGPGPGQSLPPPAPPGQSNLIAPYPPIGPNGNGYAPKKQIQLSPPEPMKPLPAEPEEDADPIKESPPEPKQPLPPQPPVKPKVTTTEDPLPSGIAQFAVALPGVTSGLRPMLDGGLDWLQKKNYQTVLHVKRPGEDDSADRKQVEKRGLKYTSLDVNPNTPLEPVLQQFAKIVTDKGSHPLFVYDKDGALAGGLWYLYFREVEEFPDDVARVRANALGLRMDGEGPHYEMWIAVQKYLADKK